jgi:hypothetical protein
MGDVSPHGADITWEMSAHVGLAWRIEKYGMWASFVL